jgi:hypothetical protein
VRKRFWIGWWYATIAIGFTLLALVHIIQRDQWWSIVLRLIIAAGFGLLAYAELSRKRP